MAWGKKPAPKPARSCRHVDVRTWTTETQGVTKPIKVRWTRCNDCGHVENRVIK